MIATPVYLGADVAKASIELFCAHLPVPRSIPNDPAGFRLLRKSLAARAQPLHVVCEATGPCHRAFVAALQAASIPVSVVNPRLVRDFARARNRLAKTDAIEARSLADYGTTMNPAPTPAGGESLHGAESNFCQFLREQGQSARLESGAVGELHLPCRLKTWICRQIA